MKNHGSRLTEPRRQVFEALQGADKPLFIGQIIKLCPKIDRVSVYRTLELFSEISIIKVLPVGFKTSYELAEPFKEHHHHIHCKVCHKIVPIQSDSLEDLIVKIADRHNFVLSDHHVELWGTCQNCQIKKR